MVQTRAINPFPGTSSNATYPHSCRRALLEELSVQSCGVSRKLIFPELTDSPHLLLSLLCLHKFSRNLFKIRSFDYKGDDTGD